MSSAPTRTDVESVMNPHETAAQAFDRLRRVAETHLSECRNAAALTMPEVLPPDGTSPDDLVRDTALATSFPATLVGNLANIVVKSLLPVDTPFFSVGLTRKGEEEMVSILAGSGDTPEAIRANMKRIQAATETKLMEEWGKWLQTSTITTLVEHAEICGQGLGVIDEDTGDIREVLPGNYVITRTDTKHLATVCVRTFAQVATLREDVMHQCLRQGRRMTDVVTMVERWEIDGVGKGDAYTYRYDMCIDGFEVESEAKDGIDRWDLPIVDVPWHIPAGASYGIGPVLRHISTIRAYHNMASAVVCGADQACNVKWIVSRGAGITTQRLAELQGGDVEYGEREGINELYASNYQSIGQAINVRQDFKADLSAVFLYQPGLVRDSERTTATEISMLVDALHSAGHSSVYSLMAKHTMPTLARVLMKRIKIRMDETIEVSVTAGNAVLSRRSEATRFGEFVQAVSMTQSMPEHVLARVDFDALLPLAASWFNIDSSQFIGSANDAQPEQASEQPEGADVTNG